VDQAFDFASDDMASMRGPTAVILVGDGEYAGKEGAGAAQRLKARYGDNVCIYTVLVGSENPENVAMMREIAAAGQCGFSQNADNLESPQDMAAWVEKVFLEKTRVTAPLDSDGDGVLDNMDQCPDTPNGVVVDSTGCPLDSDGDGVPDYLDQCPDTPEGDSVDKKGCTLEKDADRDGVADAEDRCPETPLGAPVNNSGCWIIANIEFDFNSAVIKSEYYKTLDEIAGVMQKNPQMTLKAEGHTCNLGSEAYN
jgi:OOP family OmpA-OmpF porin